MSKINRRTVMAASAAVALAPSSLRAQAWPAKPILDPREAGKILTELAKKARKNAGMNGLDLD